MNEFDLINAMNAVRIDAMKLKYYSFIQAYKKAYSENPTEVDTYEFVQAAINLAKDDVCDIIFPYSVVEEEKQKAMDEAFKEPFNMYSISDPSEDIIEIE